ncbi:MAG: pyridoxal phosphate enzyme YggS family [Ignavibacteria bacterium]|nr:MAG: pyridoxal phosphate enzyme YggS family [Ignavibacteria bacterium]KAF0162462.1 MAG: pyridoxal phosphate enzyme YggS family [Ignavibacteria bacterium]
MIAENLKKVEEKIAESCLKSGRERTEIKLIAVSKTQPTELIKETLNCGVIHLGENKAKELRDKAEILTGDFVWHFIGHLQTNKVKYVINEAEFIHSVDSIKLAEEINSKAEKLGKKQKVLLEIKTSDEATKFGLESEKEIFETAEFCFSQNSLELCGLMTMAAYTDNEKIVRRCFSRLRGTIEKINARGIAISELSMGMTNDFEWAIEEGATMIRIGTAIFGDLHRAGTTKLN